MSPTGKTVWRFAALALGALGLVGGVALLGGAAFPRSAQAQRPAEGPGAAPEVRDADRRVALGDRLFRDGEYERASEYYRTAILDAPNDGLLKLIHAHARFAIGDYAYASYEIRRGLRFLGHPDDLDLDLVHLFPTENAFRRALQTLERYLRHYPDDPVGLTTMAYVAFFSGDSTRAEAAARSLLARDAEDSFASYILRRCRLAAPPPAPPPPPPPPPPPEPPVEAQAPEPEPEAVVHLDVLPAGPTMTLVGGAPALGVSD